MKTRVHFEPTTEDYAAVLMASMGFSTKHITERTGLTPSQVSYRTAIAGVKRKDYRDGVSGMAVKIWGQRGRFLTRMDNIELSRDFENSRTIKLTAKRKKKSVVKGRKSAKR